MQIILSHEQTDFDAVGAMLAAYLLSDQSQPVLPNKINRNVRNFLNLYGFELPFVEFRDLPSKPIQSITLVDTQSLVTLKGASKKTQIHVVDHHRGRDDLPVKWSYTFEKVGATTTILVDQLQKQGESLTMIQATLLLLGIYEDTGSLTYVSTTVRDIQAAAFLLESGANLQIAADFLNPALSKGQKILADRLMEDYQIVSIHGKNIFIACADGKELNEEISSIAHKLRDLFDPDALFLLVITNEGIRMVARSTTEAVNVGKIAGVFGGGGHERASAALIDKDLPQNLPELTEHLIRELKKAILPSITVGKIMSKRPLLISPNTSLAEAELLTQKYGYEGYPVVDDGRVIGLLTRRAVDRALSHKLNINAGSLMEAGDFSVTPDQTLDQLQSLMATTGWGQIPVVDSSTQKIVGIVTRTDLLKNLTGQENAVTSPANYASLIEKALSAPRLALLKKIIQVSSQDQQGLYIVGGFVRDLIMEKPSKDFDIVIEGDALKLAQALAGQYGGRVISHRRFGTAKWQIKEIRRELFKNIMGTSEDSTDLPESLDLISARTEFYDRPSALPTVERSSIKLDLHRRDFTINTLALRLDGHHFGELHDYWGGIADLQKKQIKVLHSLSFVDDPTRLLRAVRFAIRFDFKIETRTLQLMEEARSMLKQLSGDRIRHEFDFIFDEINPCTVLDRLNELALLNPIHPALRWDHPFSKVMNSMLRDDIDPVWSMPKSVGNIPIRHALAYLIWLSRLGFESAEEISTRLRLPVGLARGIKECAGLLDKQSILLNKPISNLFQVFNQYPIVVIYALFCLSTEAQVRANLLAYATTWRYIEPVTTGETLRAMGIPPGPFYAEVLGKLRSAWLDKIITSESQENEYLITLLQP